MLSAVRQGLIWRDRCDFYICFEDYHINAETGLEILDQKQQEEHMGKWHLRYTLR